MMQLIQHVMLWRPKCYLNFWSLRKIQNLRPSSRGCFVQTGIVLCNLFIVLCCRLINFRDDIRQDMQYSLKQSAVDLHIERNLIMTSAGDFTFLHCNIC